MVNKNLLGGVWEPYGCVGGTWGNGLNIIVCVGAWLSLGLRMELWACELVVRGGCLNYFLLLN
jgi:hypothetical protein